MDARITPNGIMGKSSAREIIRGHDSGRCHRTFEGDALRVVFCSLFGPFGLGQTDSVSLLGFKKHCRYKKNT